MSIKPTRAEFDIGVTIHKQPLKLILHHRNGQDEYELRQEALNQRDEASSVRGLSLLAIKNMAEAAGLTVS